MKLTNERQAYDTHLNYIECLFDLTNEAMIKYNGDLKKAATPFLEEKKNLISLTIFKTLRYPLYPQGY